MKTSAGCEGTVEGIDVFELDERNKIQKLTSYWNPTDLSELVG